MESVASRTVSRQRRQHDTYTKWIARNGSLRMLFSVVTIWYRLAPSANDICGAKSIDACHESCCAQSNRRWPECLWFIHETRSLKYINEKFENAIIINTQSLTAFMREYKQFATHSIFIRRHPFHKSDMATDTPPASAPHRGTMTMFILRLYSLHFRKLTSVKSQQSNCDDWRITFTLQCGCGATKWEQSTVDKKEEKQKSTELCNYILCPSFEIRCDTRAHCTWPGECFLLMTAANTAPR